MAALALTPTSGHLSGNSEQVAGGLQKLRLAGWLSLLLPEICFLSPAQRAIPWPLLSSFFLRPTSCQKGRTRRQQTVSSVETISASSTNEANSTTSEFRVDQLW